MRVRISATISLLFIALLSPLQIPSALAIANGVGVVSSNLLMYYDLGNPNGISGTTLTDLTGNGYSGTIYQTSSQPSLNSSQGKYLSFAGSGTTGGYVDIPDIVSASNWTGLTVSFYANMGTRSVVERIFDFGIGQQNNNIWLGMGNTNRMAIEVFHDTASLGWCESADNSVGANEWAQWTVVLDGTNCTWYKNDVLSRSIAYSYLPWAKTLTTNYIGDSNWSSDPSFEGGIAELAIYKSALNSTERTQNFNAQTDITAPTVTSSYSLSMTENNTVVGTINTNGTYLSPVSNWDYAKFSSTNAGVLTFNAAPNYEAPTDYGSDNLYEVTIRIMDTNGNYADYAFSVTVTNVAEFATITFTSLSGAPYKGLPVTLTVTPSAAGTAGKVTFLIEGKRIPGCFKKSFTGSGTSSCIWKPTMSGRRILSFTFTPNGSEFSAATLVKDLFIQRRATTR